MKAAKHIGFAILLLAGMALPIRGGPNSGGILLVHTRDEVIFSEGVSYLGQSGITCLEQDPITPCPPYSDEEYCSSRIAQVDSVSSKGEGEYTVFWILAAFPSGSCPRMAQCRFGLAYDDSGISMEAWGTSADIEQPARSSWDGSLWPAHSSGTALTWTSPRTSHLSEIYWFAAYAYPGSGEQRIRLADHPTQAAVFLDDQMPPALDLVERFRHLTLGQGETPVQRTTWGKIKSTYR